MDYDEYVAQEKEISFDFTRIFANSFRSCRQSFLMTDDLYYIYFL